MKFLRLLSYQQFDEMFVKIYFSHLKSVNNNKISFIKSFKPTEKHLKIDNLLRRIVTGSHDGEEFCSSWFLMNVMTSHRLKQETVDDITLWLRLHSDDVFVPLRFYFLDSKKLRHFLELPLFESPAFSAVIGLFLTDRSFKVEIIQLVLIPEFIFIVLFCVHRFLFKVSTDIYIYTCWHSESLAPSPVMSLWCHVSGVRLVLMFLTICWSLFLSVFDEMNKVSDPSSAHSLARLQMNYLENLLVLGLLGFCLGWFWVCWGLSGLVLGLSGLVRVLLGKFPCWGAAGSSAEASPCCPLQDPVRSSSQCRRLQMSQ